jgi:uncharacterized Zn-finger protein
MSLEFPLSAHLPEPWMCVDDDHLITLPTPPTPLVEPTPPPPPPPPKEQQCGHPGCSKTFKFPSLAVLHRKRHTPEYKFACPESDCVKCFVQSQTMWRHVRTVHRGIKNHECEICNKRFSQLSHLESHVRYRHPETLRKRDRPIKTRDYASERKQTREKQQRKLLLVD